MTGFYYFIPDEKSINRELLSKYGLEHIVDRTDSIPYREIIRGIDGMRGTILGCGRNFTDPTQLRFQDVPKWTQFSKQHSEHRAYLGYDPDKLPTPAELERKSMLPGKPLKDELNRTWQLPTAHKVLHGTQLPRRIDEDEDGEYIYGEVVSQYRKLWDLVEQYMQACVGAAEQAKEDDATEFSFTFGNALDFCVAAFSANYRVSRKELLVMEVLNTDLFQEVLPILIDASGLEQLKKSEDLDTGDSSNGSTPSEAA